MDNGAEAYYRELVDRCGGDLIAEQARTTLLHRELGQLRATLSALSALQGHYRDETGTDIPRLFAASLEIIVDCLGYDKAFVLVPSGVTNQWALAYAHPRQDDLDEITIRYEDRDADGRLVCHRRSDPTPMRRAIAEALSLRFFAVTPMRHAGAEHGLLVVGNDIEAYPFYPAIDQRRLASLAVVGEVVAGLVHTAIRERDAELVVLQERHRNLEMAHEMAYPISFLDHLFARLQQGRGVEERHLALAGEEIARLRSMLSDLRAGTATNPHTEPVELAATVRHAVDLVRCVAGGTVHQAVPAELRIETERGALIQIVANLVRNGIAQGEVTITAQASDAGLRLVIADDGDGVPESRRTALFAGTQGSGTGGMGVGLQVCHRLARRISADLRYERSHDQSLFILHWGTTHACFDSR